MVSICGGEPLIYPQIEALIGGLLEQKRIVYICTNAMFMRKKMREWLTAEFAKRAAFVEEKISSLLAAKFDHRKRRRRHSPRTEGSVQADDRAEQLDVLERPPRWARSGRTI